MCIYSRQSSVKVKFSSESLAEQLVVWLTSEGKTSRSSFSFYLYRGRCAEAISSFSAPHWFTLMQILHIHTCAVTSQSVNWLSHSHTTCLSVNKVRDFVNNFLPFSRYKIIHLYQSDLIICVCLYNSLSSNTSRLPTITKSGV